MSTEERGIPMTHGDDRSSQQPTTDTQQAVRSTELHNMELMQTLDDAWNAHDMYTFASRHKQAVVGRSSKRICFTISSPSCARSAWAVSG